MTTSRLLRLALGAIGPLTMLAGASMPWTTSEHGLIEGTEPHAAWLVVAVVAALLTPVAHRRPRLLAAACVVMLLGVSAAALSAEAAGWMCWDGVDADGNPVGGCDRGGWTAAPALVGGGAAVTLLTAVAQSVMPPRRSAGAARDAAGVRTTTGQ